MALACFQPPARHVSPHQATVCPLTAVCRTAAVPQNAPWALNSSRVSCPCPFLSNHRSMWHLIIPSCYCWKLSLLLSLMWANRTSRLICSINTKWLRKKEEVSNNMKHVMDDKRANRDDENESYLCICRLSAALNNFWSCQFFIVTWGWENWGDKGGLCKGSLRVWGRVKVKLVLSFITQCTTSCTSQENFAMF